MARVGVIFILCVVNIINCASAYNEVRKIKQCSVHDFKCQNGLYGGVILQAADMGIPELGIPVVDPFSYKNLELTLMGLVTLKSPEIIVKGIKSCQGSNYYTSVEEKVTKVTYTCKLLTAEGKYHIHTTPAINALLGDVKIHGKGYGGFKIENVQIALELPFLFKKLNDGELHFQLINDKITFEYDILGKASVFADNLFIGNQDISAVAVNIFNENWKVFVKVFAESVVRLGVDVLAENSNKFLGATPVKDLVIEDLSPYAG